MSTEIVNYSPASADFTLDETRLAKFETLLTRTVQGATELVTVIESATRSVISFTTDVASGLDNLYRASQRTGASARGIQAIEYAATQAGSSAEAALGSLENVSRYISSDTGAEDVFRQLDVQIRDGSGKMRDMADIFADTGGKLSAMPLDRARTLAQTLGIDDATLEAMRSGMAQFSVQYGQMAKAVGFDADSAAVSANTFMTSLRAFNQLEALVSDKAGAKLANGLAGLLDKLSDKILDNFSAIEKGIDLGVDALLWLADVVSDVVLRLIASVGELHDWWTSLDGDTQGLIAMLGALAGAWALFNGSFISSPLGIITGLLTALMLLYDDYQKWKQGSDSLIDWAAWEPAIEQAKVAIGWLSEHLINLKNEVGGWQTVLEGVAAWIAGTWVGKVLRAFGEISGLKLPSWMYLWTAYAGYLYSDRDNIVSSAQASWHYTKGEIGRALRWIGIDTDFGRNPDAHNPNPTDLSDIPNDTPWFTPSAADGNIPATTGRPDTGWSGLRSVVQILSQLTAPGESKSGGLSSHLLHWMGLSDNPLLNLQPPLINNALSLSSGYAWDAGRSGYSPSGGSTINQETTIHIHGVSNPQQAGDEVARRQLDINSRLTQTRQMEPR